MKIQLSTNSSQFINEHKHLKHQDSIPNTTISIHFLFYTKISPNEGFSTKVSPKNTILKVLAEAVAVNEIL